MGYDNNNLDSFLIQGVEPEGEPSLEDATISFGDDYVITPAEESAIFLDALYEGCDSVDEFYSLVEEDAVNWEMHGIIDNATMALEAVKRMKIDNWKVVNRDRVAGSEAIRMAKRENSADYKKYKKYRDLYLKYKAKIEKRYHSRAKAAARKSISNSQHKVGTIKSALGTSISQKLDKVIKKLNKDGRNGTAIKEKGA